VNDWIALCKIDDPVGAIGVHGAAAVWGILAVGLFADGQLAGIQVASGLFRGGGFRLLEVQLLLIASIFGWSLLAVTPFFVFVGWAFGTDCRNPRKGLRVDEASELQGLDSVYHGCPPKKKKRSMDEPRRRRKSVTSISSDCQDDVVEDELPAMFLEI